jgi:hypothetical protein
MYRGTLIQELMATVAEVEQTARRRQIMEEMELQRMYELQIPEPSFAQFFAGAA